VAHTKPRQERALSEALVSLEVPCFLPLVPQVRFYGHRKRAVELPLFPSYVFLHGTREQALDALRTKRIAHLIPVPDQARLDHELRQLDLAIAGKATLDPFPYLAVGKRVVVVRGPFIGLEGLVDERLSAWRLVLNVSLLGRATSLEIDASVLEAVE
jgi:transcriptional antiterminator RfaH